LQTILLLKSAFLCVSRFFGLSSFDTVTTLILSRLASFLPFFEVIPEIFSIFANVLYNIKNITMKKTFTQICELFDQFSKDANLQMEKGNKAAGTRARKVSLELEKLLKQFRKESLEASK